MSTRIRLLSNETINQIAAGEVIENPASVVKELIENALDAGATQVTVTVKGGGLQYIRVSDNGYGMGPEDALLSLERHATSKIQNTEDLFSLKSMGFRGEALASIAAISKVSVLTSLGGSSGTFLDVEGGKIINTSSGARNRGTTIEVRSLFYNVPARKKFQKSPTLCAADIFKCLVVLSLSHPQVAFELVQQDRPALSAPAIDQEDKLGTRIKQVLGEEFLDATHSIFFEEEGLKISGYIGSPLKTKPNRLGQYLFINERAVFCPALSFAIKESYGTRIEANRYPLFVLHLAIDASLIDVNVHPQKKEVRLKEEAKLKAQIGKAVEQALKKEETPLPFSSISYSFSPTYSYNDLPSPSILSFKEQKVEEKNLSLELPVPLEVIGLFSNYLLISGASMGKEEGIVLVDLLAASARILFESLYLGKEKKEKAQGLLFPRTFSLSPSDAAMLCSALPTLQEEMGFGILQTGPHSFLIDALPAAIKEEVAEELIKEMLSDLTKEETSLATTMAKKLSITAERIAKAHKRSFMLQEAIELVKKLMQCEAPLQAPSGRRTFISLNLYEIEHYFKRKS